MHDRAVRGAVPALRPAGSWRGPVQATAGEGGALPASICQLGERSFPCLRMKRPTRSLLWPLSPKPSPSSKEQATTYNEQIEDCAEALCVACVPCGSSSGHTRREKAVQDSDLGPASHAVDKNCAITPSSESTDGMHEFQRHGICAWVAQLPIRWRVV